MNCKQMTHKFRELSNCRFQRMENKYEYNKNCIMGIKLLPCTVYSIPLCRHRNGAVRYKFGVATKAKSYIIANNATPTTKNVSRQTR
jgi:hypothetical protein